MIALAISQFHSENVVRLTKIDNSLVRQDEKLEELASSHKNIDTKLDTLLASNNTLLTRSTTWNKASFYRSAWKWLTFILALMGAVIGYLSYRAKVGHEISKTPTVASQPHYNASQD